MLWATWWVRSWAARRAAHRAKLRLRGEWTPAGEIVWQLARQAQHWHDLNRP